MLSISSRHAILFIEITLFYTQMSINRGVSGCSRQVLTLSVGNVFSISLNVPFGQSKVQNKDLVGSFIQTDTEIIWLNVSVNKMTVVNVFNTLYHLVDQHQDRFE